MSALVIAVPPGDQPPPHPTDFATNTRPGLVSGAVRLVSAPPGVSAVRALVYDLTAVDGGPPGWRARSETITLRLGGAPTPVGSAYDGPRYADGAAVIGDVYIPPEACFDVQSWPANKSTPVIQYVPQAVYEQRFVTRPVGTVSVSALWLALPGAPAGSYAIEVLP